MKRKLIMMVLGIVFTLSLTAKTEKGLLIVTHGSNRSGWKEEIVKFENKLKINRELKDRFKEIKAVYLEANQPSIAEGMKEFSENGIKDIYAISLFIAGSVHVNYDIPAVFGVYKKIDIIEDLKEEGIEVCNTDSKITLRASNK